MGFFKVRLSLRNSSCLLVSCRRWFMQTATLLLCAVHCGYMCSHAAAKPLRETTGHESDPCQLSSRSPFSPEGIPAHLVSPLDLIQLREITDVSLSPDGSIVVFQVHAALVASNSFCTRWYAIGSDGRSGLKDLGGGGDPPWDEIGQWQSSKPTWTADSNSFLHLMYVHGHYQLWRTFVRTAHSIPIFRRNRDVRAFCWGGNQRSIVVEVGPVEAERTSAFRKLVREGVVYDYSFNESVAPLETEQDLGPQLPSAPTYILVDSNGRSSRNANKEDLDYLKNHLSTPYQQQKPSPDGAAVASIQDVPGPSGDRFNSFAIFVARNGSDPERVTSTFRTVTQFWCTSSNKEIIF